MFSHEETQAWRGLRGTAGVPALLQLVSVGSAAVDSTKCEWKIRQGKNLPLCCARAELVRHHSHQGTVWQPFI